MVGLAEGIQDWRHPLLRVLPQLHQAFCVCLCTERLGRSDFVLLILVIVYSGTDDDVRLCALYTVFVPTALKGPSEGLHGAASAAQTWTR